MPNPKFNKKWDNKRHNRFKRDTDRAPFNKRPYTPRPKHNPHYKTLSEKEVGITEYVSDLTGFSAVIKARYSDFHVNEIDLSGNVAKLTNLAVPALEAEEVEEDKVERPQGLITEETWDRITAIAESNEDTAETVEIDVTGLSKEDRTTIHKTVSKAFPKRIVASTVTKDDAKKFVQLRQYQKHLKDPRAPQDNRNQLPGEYTHFLLYKESIDTLQATYKISSKLRIKASAFAYAGVKDRRAKTTQWFSVRRVVPHKLLNCTKGLQNIRLGNVCFKDEALKLGQLRGNRFRIALRNVCAEDGLIDRSLEAVKSEGFINYYGLQRQDLIKLHLLQNTCQI